MNIVIKVLSQGPGGGFIKFYVTVSIRISSS